MKLKLVFSTLLLIAASFFTAGSAVNVKTANALPDTTCAFDLYYILDLSGSMNDNISGGGGKKINIMKSKITELNTTLSNLNSNTQIGYTAFSGRDSGNPLPDTFVGSYERRWLTNDITTLNNQINALSAFDGTPLPGAISHAMPGFRNNGKEGNIPVAILVSDGVPTLYETPADSHSNLSGWRTYDVNKVSTVNIKDSSGNFLTPEQVELLGEDNIDTWQNPHIAGEILAATMRASLAVETLSGEPQVTMGLFMEGQGTVDNPDIVEHFGSINGGSNFFNAATADQMLNSMISLLDESCSQNTPESGTVSINLPPKSVYTPKQMLLEKQTFNFVDGQFSPRIHNDGEIKIDTFIEMPETDLESYRIDISGLRRGQAVSFNNSSQPFAFNKFFNSMSAKAYSPPPATNVLLLIPPAYDIKMTFEDIASTSVLARLSSQVGSYEYASLGDSSCASSANPTHICFRTKVRVVNFSNAVNGQLYLRDSVEMDFPGTITVEGNVLATETIGGFTLPSGTNQNWLAVGGTVEASVSANDDQKLNDYVSGNAKLEWGDIGDTGSIAFKLSNKKNEGIEIATVFAPDVGQSTSTFNNGNFNLNAPATNPRAAGQSTFSTGAEGKVWYNGNTNSTVTFNNVNVTGKGTLIVRGNLVVNGALTCSNNTSFGVIATGSVIFNSPNIECGAYAALGEVNSGEISINTTVIENSSATGIFIAKGNVNLPAVNPGKDYRLTYDSNFALEPPILFSDLLSIVFSTSS